MNVTENRNEKKIFKKMPAKVKQEIKIERNENKVEIMNRSALNGWKI